MARQKGIYQLEGSIGGVSHYTMKKYGDVVRTKGGPSKEQIEKGKNFKKTRKNISEFGQVARSGKVIRQAFLPWMKTYADFDITSRLVSVLQQIKQYDLTNVHGRRHVRYAFYADEAKQLLTSFAFRSAYPMKNILLVPAACDARHGTITLNGFCPARHIAFHLSATHIGLTCAFSAISFSRELSETVYSERLVLRVEDSSLHDVVLQPSSLPRLDELQLTFLLVEFLQQGSDLSLLYEGTSLGCVRGMGTLIAR